MTRSAAQPLAFGAATPRTLPALPASAGDFAFGPRGIPHRYTVGAAGCRMLFIMTPGGFENLVREMSVPALSCTLPPASDEEPDWGARGERRGGPRL